MPIEFSCTQCQRMLRVPDGAAGAKAKCPQCGAIVNVPTPGSLGDADPGIGDQSASSFPPAPSSNPFGDNLQPLQPTPKPANDGSVNPYSVSSYSDEQIGSKSNLPGGIVPTAVDAGPIINYAWEVLKSNLGIMVGVTATVLGIGLGVGMIQVAVELLFEAQGEVEMAAIGILSSKLIEIFGNLINLFLGIGQAQIALKLLRRQQVEFGELFYGGPLFLRVLGASFLAGLAMFFGALACFIPAIVLALLFWPFYWLLVDEKATAIESFSMAMPIGKVNALTTFVLWLASVGIMLAGVLAFCIGIIFAAPLVTLMWGTAYLMMSGQLPVYQR